MCGQQMSHCCGSCIDNNANCPAYASSGYCTHSYVDYMQENCKESCNLCSTTGNTSTTFSMATTTPYTSVMTTSAGEISKG